MIFRQLFDAESSTYTYLLADEATRQALLIDPVREQVERDLELLRDLDLRLTYVLDTHVHADHVTASGALRERTSCLTVGGTRGASCADLRFGHGDLLRLGDLSLRVLATPGHTDDSVSYLLDDRVFTGDALLVRATGRTDFQNGNAGQLYDSITRVLFTLPDETLVYPAHDYRGRTVTTIGEEKRHNPRIAGKTRDEFIRIMNELHLPPPKKLDTAVPANHACGRTADNVTPAGAKRAAQRAYQGVPAAVVDRLGPAVRRIDVREPQEYVGPLGHLPGAELVPLERLELAARNWPRDEPLLLICRSGNRSATAAQLLADCGFTHLYNLEGGMIAVHEAASAAAASLQSA